MTAREDFWNDPDRATALLKERTRVSDLIDTWDGIFEEIDEVGDPCPLL